MNVTFSSFARVTSSPVAPCERVRDLVPTCTKKGPRPLRRSNARSRKARLWWDWTHADLLGLGARTGRVERFNTRVALTSNRAGHW